MIYRPEELQDDLKLLKSAINDVGEFTWHLAVNKRSLENVLGFVHQARTQGVETINVDKIHKQCNSPDPLAVCSSCTCDKGDQMRKGNR